MMKVEGLSDVHAQLRRGFRLGQVERVATRGSWVIDRFQTPVNRRELVHYAVSNVRHAAGARSAWIRFHGSGRFDAAYARRMLDQSLEWILNHGEASTVYAFVTTATTQYEGGWHSLSSCEESGINADYDRQDFGYALVGGRQLRAHLSHLRTSYGVRPSPGRVTVVGYSDGGWMASMSALRGECRHAAAWAGFSFAGFDSWKTHLPKRLRGMRLHLYISAGDAYFDGSSNWFPASQPSGVDSWQAGSMRDGLQSISSHLRLTATPSEEVRIGGVPFQRTLFVNAEDDNRIAYHLDPDVSHPHEWLRADERMEFLQATALVRDADIW